MFYKRDMYNPWGARICSGNLMSISLRDNNVFLNATESSRLSGKTMLMELFKG